MTISSWLHFGCPVPPGRGSAVGRKIFAQPYYSQGAVFASLWALFSLWLRCLPRMLLYVDFLTAEKEKNVYEKTPQMQVKTLKTNSMKAWLMFDCDHHCRCFSSSPCDDITLMSSLWVQPLLLVVVWFRLVKPSWIHWRTFCHGYPSCWSVQFRSRWQLPFTDPVWKSG